MNTPAPAPAAAPAVAPSVADINSINTKVAGINSMLPAGTAPLTPISVDALTANTQPVDTTAPVRVPTQSAGLASYLGTTADQYTKSLAADAAAAKTSRDASLDEVTKALAGQEGTAQITAQEDANAGLPGAQSDLADINNQILAEKVATDHQIEALKKNPQGLYGSALNDEIQRVQDASTARLADLSVIQLARQGKVQLANDVASRAVAARTEAQTNKINTLQFIYDQNKENFTTAEQRAFETAQTDRNRQLDLQKSEELARYQEIIKNEYGGGSGGTFTPTQLHSGAANAGIDISAFNNLSQDDKNYFINGYGGFTNALKQYQTGAATEDDLRKAINASNLSDAGKAILFQRAGISATAPAGGGFWSNAANFVGSLFGA